MTLKVFYLSICINMKAKSQVVFDIQSEKFKYLMRDQKEKSKVDIDILNKRLNEVRRLNLYTNVKMIALSLFVILVFALIGLKF